MILLPTDFQDRLREIHTFVVDASVGATSTQLKRGQPRPLILGQVRVCGFSELATPEGDDTVPTVILFLFGELKLEIITVRPVGVQQDLPLVLRCR